jgi:hypothetical protein
VVLRSCLHTQCVQSLWYGRERKHILKTCGCCCPCCCCCADCTASQINPGGTNSTLRTRITCNLGANYTWAVADRAEITLPVIAGATATGSTINTAVATDNRNRTAQDDHPVTVTPPDPVTVSLPPLCARAACLVAVTLHDVPGDCSCCCSCSVLSSMPPVQPSVQPTHPPNLALYCPSNPSSLLYPQSPFTITKTGPTQPVLAGQPFSYSIIVGFLGTAKGVKVTDLLPPSVLPGTTPATWLNPKTDSTGGEFERAAGFMTG